MAKTPLPNLLCEMARRRLECLPPVDLRTPEERRRDNDELVRRLEGRLPPEVHRVMAEVVSGREDEWHADLKRALGNDRFLDVCEASLILDREG